MELGKIESDDLSKRLETSKAWITDLDGTLAVLDIDWEKVREKVRSILEVDHPLRPLAISIPLVAKDDVTRQKAYDYIEWVEVEAARKVTRDETLVAMVKLIRRHNVKLGLVTHQARVPARLTLKNLGVLDYFKAIISRDDVLNRLEQIERAAGLLNVNVQEVVFTGDSPWDVDAGKRLGCLTLCVRERHSGADVFIDSIYELGPLWLGIHSF